MRQVRATYLQHGGGLQSHSDFQFMNLDEDNDEERRLAQLIKSEVALINRLVGKLLGPEATREQREDMQAILGHSYRLGGMLMETHQSRARQTAPSRKALKSKKIRRDQIIDAQLLAERDSPPKVLEKKINTELQKHGFKPASLSHIYQRRTKILGLSDKES